MLTSPLQSLRYPRGEQRRLMTGIAERVEGGRAPLRPWEHRRRSSRIVAFGRPGGEDHDDTSTTITCDAVVLARLEREQRSWPRVNDVAARLDPRRSLDYPVTARSRSGAAPSSSDEVELPACSTGRYRSPVPRRPGSGPRAAARPRASAHAVAADDPRHRRSPRSPPPAPSSPDRTRRPHVQHRPLPYALLTTDESARVARDDTDTVA
jgi:hypothetical protein